MHKNRVTCSIKRSFGGINIKLDILATLKINYRMWILCLGHWQDLAYCLIDETDQSVWISLQCSLLQWVLKEMRS